jgi:hypothetical protein
VPVVERRRVGVVEDEADEGFVAKQLRRNCGVGVDSKGALIS